MHWSAAALLRGSRPWPLCRQANEGQMRRLNLCLDFFSFLVAGGGSGKPSGRGGRSRRFPGGCARQTFGVLSAVWFALDVWRVSWRIKSFQDQVDLSTSVHVLAGFFAEARFATTFERSASRREKTTGAEGSRSSLLNGLFAFHMGPSRSYAGEGQTEGQREQRQ